MRNGRRRPLWGAALVLGMLVSPLAMPSAQAGSIAIQQAQVTVSPNSAVSTWGQPITTRLSFCTPDSARAGDSFTLGLPSVIRDWPAGFEIKDAAGTVVYNVAIAGTPGVATFTLTDAGASAVNLCSEATFAGTVGAAAGGTHPLRFTVNRSTALDGGTMTVTLPVYDPPQYPSKNGWFTNQADQCRTSTDGCLIFRFRTPMSPGPRVVIDDPAGPGWTWDCDSMQPYDRIEVHTYANGTRTSVRGAAGSPARTQSFQCSPDRVHLEVDTSQLGERDSFEAYLVASAKQASPAGGVSFPNEATMELNGTPQQYAVDVQSSWARGHATTASIEILNDDAAGNTADTQADAVPLAGGSTEKVITVRNSGNTALRDVRVTTEQVSGPGTTSGLSCDFSPLGGPADTTTWEGPLEVGQSVTCRAALSGVTGLNQDRARVTAGANGVVTASNDYWSTVPAQPMNLTLSTSLISPAPFRQGDAVELRLVPRNTGGLPAAAGWRVTQVLPPGLDLVSMSGAGYDCAGLTCTAQAPLAPGATGPAVTVRATIAAGAQGTLRSVAYVSPAAGDVAESNPLAVPDTTTDTGASATDNDDSAEVTVQPAAAAVPAPAGPNPGNPAPAPANPVPVSPANPAPAVPAASAPALAAPEGSATPAPPAQPAGLDAVLAETGAVVTPWAAGLALVSLGGGVGLVASRLRRS